jgi:hydroxyacylglutathione hydrolase
VTHAPEWLAFFERRYPSANMALIRGERPVLVDTGYGSDLTDTEDLLREAGVPPESLSLIVNTHYHSDHVGGNGGLQRGYGTPVAAHRWEAALVNDRDREACGAEWLGQPVEPYEANLPLSDGDEVDAGGVALEVLHTPGHTLGHVSLYAPEERVFIFGDAVHGDDVAWINPYREGAGAVVRALESLDRLASLPVRWACSGHGPAIEDPLATIDAAPVL